MSFNIEIIKEVLCSELSRVISNDEKFDDAYALLKTFYNDFSDEEILKIALKNEL